MFQFFFAFLITVMAVSFGINYFVDIPDQVKNAPENEPFLTDDIFKVSKKDDEKNQSIDPPGRSGSGNSCSLVGQQRCFDAGNLPVKIHLTDDVLAAT